MRQAESRIGIEAGSAFDPVRVPEVQAAQAAYESAKAKTTLAEAEAARYAELFESGDVSRSNYEKYKIDADSAKAQAEAAKQQYRSRIKRRPAGISGCRRGPGSPCVRTGPAGHGSERLWTTPLFRAPFAGQVTARPVAVGEYVSKSSKLVTVVRSNPLKLQLQMPEANASRIRLGLRVTAHVAAYPTQEFTGEVSAINPAISVESRALTVEVRFQNPDLRLQPGMFATSTSSA